MTVPPEELRFAVVLNGGVSLAVWMGGAVRELHALTQPGSPYAAVTDLLNVRARADVIAGTSAGGINGAVLALAQANRNADVGILRDLWAEQGRMESLLQRPFRGSPPSLLRGDDYFLPRLRDAMGRLCTDFDATDVAERPVDLTITTTLLHGARTVAVDAFGQRLPQTQHDGRFHFQRLSADVVDPGSGEAAGDRDDFDPARHPDVAAALALAARSTAGFPVAFEPSFVPARQRPAAAGTTPAPGTTPTPDATSAAAERPDLGAHVSWRTAGPADEVPDDRSRFAVDGGLLANTPTRPALAAIDRLPAGPAVARVMLLMYPHAPEDVVDPPDREDEPPTLTATMGGLLGALSSQGDRTFVDEVEEHNRLAASRRGTRADILRTAGTPDALHALAVAVFPHYRELRIRRAGRDLAARYVPPTDWSYERIRQAAEAAQQAWVRPDDPDGFLPYVPPSLPTGAPAVDPAPADAAPTDDAAPADGAAPTVAGGWGWGVTAALDVADIALDLLKRLVWVVPAGQGPADPAARVEGARRAVHGARADLTRARQLVDGRWSRGVLSTLPPDQRYWSTRLAVYRDLMLAPKVGGGPSLNDAARALADAAAADLPPDEAQARRRDVLAALLIGPDDVGAGQLARDAVDAVVDAVGAAADVMAGLDDDAQRLADLLPWRALITGLPAALERHEALLARLLWLHVAGWTIGDEVMSGNAYPVDLVQLSLRTQNPFAVYSTRPDEKVGGLSVHRFGGFLKTSWRLNDWAWGRVDAATTLSQVLLTTARLRRRALVLGQLADSDNAARGHAERFVADLVTALYGPPTAHGAASAPAPASARTDLPRAVTECCRRAVAELTPVHRADPPPDGPPVTLPARLPALASLLAWALHLRIAIEELPAIAAGVAVDVNEGGNPRSRGALFCRLNADLLRELADRAPHLATGGPLPPNDVALGMRALDAFDRAGIGREPLEEEGTSDQMIRTATTAASVAVTVVDGDRSGLGAVKPVTRALRGLMLLPYWVVTGLASGARIARFLALLALALGAVALTLSLFGVLGGWAGTLGAGALLVAFGYAALRTGSLLHGVVLLTPVIPLLAFSLQGRGAPAAIAGTTAGSGGGTVVAVLALALALMVLGSLPAPLESPLRTLSGRFRGLLLAAAVVGVAVVVALLLVRSWALLVDVVPTWHRNPGWVAAACVALVAVGALIAWWWGNRPFDVATADDGTPPRWRWHGVSHPAAVTAGWSVVYAAVYLAIAAALVWWWQPSWSTSWFWTALLLTCATFGAVLAVVVPVVVPWLARRRVRREMASGGAAPGGGPPLNVLVARGLTYRFLVEIGDEGRTLVPR